MAATESDAVPETIFACLYQPWRALSEFRLCQNRTSRRRFRRRCASLRWHEHGLGSIETNANGSASARLDDGLVTCRKT
jgi:hypothetical protein